MFKVTKYCAILWIFIISCAVIEEPSGGPKDTSPPEIASFSPKNMSTDFKGNSIELEFTKYMNNSKVVDNIAFTPSVTADYSWSGKTLYIEFEEPLKENTTYSMQIGTEYSDWKNNKPASAFALIFSTGSKIDSGKISGELLADKERLQGAYVFVYRIDNIDPDTLDPTHTKPDYKTQIGSSGKFEVLALKDGTYRVMAVRDRFKDDIVDIGTDDFGAAIDDVTVNNGTSSPFKIMLGPPPDKLGPLLISAKSVNNMAVDLSFTEPVLYSSLTTDAIRLSKVNTLNYIDISAIFPLAENRSALRLITRAPLDTASEWTVEVTGITDTLGNTIQDTGRTASFYVFDSQDYPSPAINSFPFKDSTALAKPYKEFSFIFNTAVKLKESESNIKLIKHSDSSSVPIEANFSPPNVLNIKGIEKLEPNKWFTLDLPLSLFESYYGTRGQDTLYSLRFQNYDIRNFSNIDGSVEPADLCDNMIIKLYRGDLEIYVTPDKNGKWKVDRIPEGKYNIELICDKNNNGKYDHGYPFPYQFAENFFVLKKELKVRAGWDITDFILKVEE